MKLTPERLARLKAIKAYQRAGEIHATVEITDEAFRALIADLEEATAARGNGVLVPAPKLKEMQAELAATRKQFAEAQAKLAHLAEYWNRDENEIAMKDACWHTVEVAEASDTSALDAAIAEAIEPYRKDAERYQIVRAAMFDEHLMGLIGMHDEELEPPDEFDRVVSAAIAATAPHDLPSEQSYLDRGGCLRLEAEK